MAGHVLIMHYEDNGMHYYRISCSTVPDEHLCRTVEGEELSGNTNTLDLVYKAKANNMFGAKAKVKLVLQGMGLKKDENRGGDQDWFWCENELDIENLEFFANAAVEAHNSNHPMPPLNIVIACIAYIAVIAYIASRLRM